MNYLNLKLNHVQLYTNTVAETIRDIFSFATYCIRQIHDRTSILIQQDYATSKQRYDIVVEYEIYFCNAFRDACIQRPIKLDIVPFQRNDKPRSFPATDVYANKTQLPEQKHTVSLVYRPDVTQTRRRLSAASWKFAKNVAKNRPIPRAAGSLTSARRNMKLFKFETWVFQRGVDPSSMSGYAPRSPGSKTF